MIESIKITAVGIIFAIICIIVKHYRAEFIIPTRVAAIILLFGVILALLTPVFEYLEKLMGQTLPLEYMEIVIKALAIAFVTQASSEICRDCGENNIAASIETIGKIEIIILSLPLINKIVMMSEELVSW